MLSSLKTIELVSYWLESSKEKRKTMESLYVTKRYADCLFFGHLILEKVLKALVVLKTKEHAPYIHNLIRLAELAGMDLTKDVTKLLVQVNDFNLGTRYPDARLEFYRVCNKNYTDQFYQPILDFYLELCQNVRQQTLQKRTPKP